MEFSDSNDVFMSDPFLSLDNDLDDVSEVIRSNMVGDYQKGIFDVSRTPSPQYLHDAEVYIPQMMQHQTIFSEHRSKEKQIDNIVSQLQEELINSESQQNLFNNGNDLNLFSNLETIQNNNANFNFPARPPVSNSTLVSTNNNINSLFNNNNIPASVQQPHYYTYDECSAAFVVAPANQEELSAQHQSQQHQHMDFQTEEHGQYAVTGDYLVVEYPQVMASTSTDNLNSTIDEYNSNSGVMQYAEAGDGNNLTSRNEQHQIIQIPSGAFPSIIQNIPQNHVDSHIHEKTVISNPQTTSGIIRYNQQPPQNSLAQQPLQPHFIKQEILMDDQRALNNNNNIQSRRIMMHQATHLSLERQQQFGRRMDEKEVEQQLLALNVNQNSNLTSPTINTKTEIIRMLLEMTPIELSKSATLRKAIEHINALRVQNAELQRTNERLRAALNSAGLTIGGIESPPPQPPLPASMLMRSNAEHKFYGRNGRMDADGSSRDSSQSPANSTTYSPPNNCSPQNQTNGRLKKQQTVIPISNSNGSVKRGRRMLGQSRISLCVFMCMMLVFNPVSMFLTSLPGVSLTESSRLKLDSSVNVRSSDSNNIIKQQQNIHRTLRSGGVSLFDIMDGNDQNYLDLDDESEAEQWWHAAYLRHAFVWVINTCIVLFVLLRLLVYGEPVADGRSQAWAQFLIAKQNALNGIRVGNYREAQRQLKNSLKVFSPVYK